MQIEEINRKKTSLCQRQVGRTSFEIFLLLLLLLRFQRSITINDSSELSPSMIASSHSRASDTSSAYSGSDIMQSSTNGDDALMNNNDTDEESDESDDVKMKFFFISERKTILFCSKQFQREIIFEKH
mgnify:CR=1 FL=1